MNLNKCENGIHIFEYSENHPYNRPEGSGGNCRSFPVGHTCLCGEKVYEAPVLDERIKEGSMIHKITGSTSPIESFRNEIIPSFVYGKT